MSMLKAMLSSISSGAGVVPCPDNEYVYISPSSEYSLAVNPVVKLVVSPASVYSLSTAPT